MAVSSLGGLAIGAVSFFVPYFATNMLYRRVTRGVPIASPSVIEWCIGTSVVLCAMASPFLAWLLAGLAVHSFLH
jgi:hypothetical protein